MDFNLSAWALRNRQIVLYIMLLLAVVGGISYTKLGQSEDPPFTFKAMVVRTNWPGASAEEIASQVTERIEKKLMETGEYERIVSFSRPGESMVTFIARDSMHSEEIPDLWYQVRKKVGDIRHTLPPGIQGPFFNDEFGTTFGNIYALTGAGFDYAVLKDYADRVQLQLSVPFESVEDTRTFPIRVAERTFRIGDVAEVKRGFNDPPAPRMRFMGEDAIGLAVSMKAGGDILVLGDALETDSARLQETLPAGMQLRKVSDQPAAAKTAIGEFIRVLTEAVIIVLLVSFFSLGLRTGLVVALSIPLVLAMTFAAMYYLGIGLHKISLGALVLALGLMVDDAIIAVE